jgi:hypothetical protein
VTSRLVTQLPRKHRRTASIPRHQRLDVILVRLLRRSIRIERGSITPKRGIVSINSTVVVPIIHKREDEFNAVFFRRVDNVVQTRDAV